MCGYLQVLGQSIVIPIWRECSVFRFTFTKWRISNWSRIGRYNLHQIRWPGKHVTWRETVYHCCCDCFIFYRNNDFSFSFYMKKVWVIGVFCKNGFNTIIVLSTKLNDNHQVDTMDMFQSKGFVIFLPSTLPCSLPSFTYCIDCTASLHCVKRSAREEVNVRRKHERT